ncbi:MAG TPA: NAD(P)/FAD-dependent oxidoreductase [Vicinamibacterales bacterium]|jgi:geranylgeranyl reductase family protein
MYDVVIVGAGPGGLSAGLHLARHGLRAIVIEEHQAVGTPVHCTGILAREAFEEFDLSRNSILNELTTAKFLSPAGREVFYRTGAVEAVVVDRAQFDARLAEQAEQAGARIVRGVRAAAMRCDTQGVFVNLVGHPSISARAAVLACGGKYALHRQLGFGLPSLFLHTAQAELPASRPQDVELHFGRDIAPKGFAWAVPVWRQDRSYARVGVMCEADAPRYFRRMVERQRQTWGLQVEAGCQPRQKILPLTAIPRTYADRVLVVGDAAGLVKPTTGGGIYYSLLSAKLAADVLVTALNRNDLSSSTLAEYERRWRARLGSELSAQLSLRTLAQQMSDGDIEKLFELARTDGVMPIVRRTASFNRHRKLILALFKHPPARQILFRSLVF